MIESNELFLHRYTVCEKLSIGIDDKPIKNHPTFLSSTPIFKHCLNISLKLARSHPMKKKNIKCR